MVITRGSHGEKIYCVALLREDDTANTKGDTVVSAGVVKVAVCGAWKEGSRRCQFPAPASFSCSAGSCQRGKSGPCAAAISPQEVPGTPCWLLDTTLCMVTAKALEAVSVWVHPGDETGAARTLVRFLKCQFHAWRTNKTVGTYPDR